MIEPLVIDISRQGNTLKMGAYHQSDLTLKHYSEHEVKEPEITKLSQDIAEHLTHLTHSGAIEDHLIRDLKKTANLLYDELFTFEVKACLRQSVSQHLMVSMDESLVQIPWELLFDGEEFLCLKYAMGRLVRTKQKPHVAMRQSTQTHPAARMLMIADPTGDLDEAYEEGQQVMDEIDRHRKRIRIETVTTRLDIPSIKKNIRDYDIVHFAGHAEYDAQDPSQSGWLFHDGKLTARELIQLGASQPLPRLIFSNACESARTEAWKVEGHLQDKIYGLANAFLLAGTKHYIGTFWKVADRSSLPFAKAFYQDLVQGISIGEALRNARKTLFENAGSQIRLAGGISRRLFCQPRQYADGSERRLQKSRLA